MLKKECKMNYENHSRCLKKSLVWRSVRKKGESLLCTQIQCVNKLLKPSRVLLSMHKPFELVFLICLGWQPFVQAESNMREYHHNTGSFSYVNSSSHTQQTTHLWHYSQLISCHLWTCKLIWHGAGLGCGWVIFKSCSGWSDDLLLSRHAAPSLFVFIRYNSKFPQRLLRALRLCPF